MEKNIILILLLAPLSVIICFYLKKYIFHKLEKSYLFVLPTIFYFLIFLLLLINQNDLNELSFKYIKVHDINISLSFSFNHINKLMSLVVLIVSICVLIYSSSFIKSENIDRYFRYSFFISIFISAMIFFSLSNDLLSSFIFWEFLGLCSFFLIAYYNKDKKAIFSSLMAFWITRFGDLFFLMGIIIVLLNAESLMFSQINNLYTKEYSNIQNISLLFICIGVLTKCAQFPFTIWLPRAMKGPTPVSALIHSATMVVAGVLLLFKLAPAIGNYQLTQNFIFYAGLITSLTCSIHAFKEDDFKKILAYSTLSHIGFMLIPIGQNLSDLSYFHLYSHSFFKSMLFLMAGYIILTYNSTSIKDLKNKVKINSVMGFSLLIGCLSLAGVFPLTGSFSKEYIIINFISDRNVVDIGLLFISLFFTCMYSSKILFTVISFENIKFNADKNIILLIPIVILGIFSLLGFQTKDVFDNFINPNFPKITFYELVLIQIFIVSSFGIFYFKESRVFDLSKNFFNFSSYFVEIEKIYITIYKHVFIELANFVAWFDRNIIDGIINFIPYQVSSLSLKIQSVQNGFIRNYAAILLIFIILLIILLGVGLSI